ncbi:hypothetical protein [Natrinema soli]|uniref:Uncharacterized protein n=1 Tax=Natrinema soli TaxID=1930624 RepID=A0ABD5SJW7_9EURY|nr:hypothetical protein [Natrinema soli]
MARSQIQRKTSDKGEILVAEVYELEGRLNDEEQEQFDENPKEIIRDILENEGHEVNNVIVSQEVADGVALQGVVLHVVTGENASTYIIVKTL